MRRILPLLLLAGCSPSLRDELEEIRAERVTLEREIHPAKDAPLWVREGKHAFEQYLSDGDASVPSFIYDHVLRKLGVRKAEEIRGEAREGFDWERFVARPAAYRGDLWRVGGTISRIWVEEIRDPECPVARVYAGIFYTEAGGPVLFHLLEKPQVLELRSDFVEIDGLFLKVFRLRGPGGSTLSAPFFVAKAMRKIL